MEKPLQHIDYLIIGAGIAGCGLAYFLSAEQPNKTILVVDMEASAGYHTTGRSAAFYAESYGGPLIRPLTSASKAFLSHPPPKFTDTPLFRPRGALHIFDEARQIKADAMLRDMSDGVKGLRIIRRDALLSYAPCLAGGDWVGAVMDSDCQDIDVAALHHGYIKGAKTSGVKFLLSNTLKQADFDGEHWQITFDKSVITARTIVNAAGAWADDVAKLCGIGQLGLTPLKRTIITVPNQGIDTEKPDTPLIIDIDENFYFKSEGMGYLISPADETLSAACDAQPDIEDIAHAIDLFSRACGVTLTKIEAKWAGLRTFAPDRVPVIGFDTGCSGFFWNAGQGGYGIQTSPAWSMLAARLLGQNQSAAQQTSLAPVDHIDAAPYSPKRFKIDRFG